MKISASCAVVTGGGRGIGRQISIGLAKNGVNVIINYAGNEKAAEQTRTECEALGVRALTVKGDVSIYEDCEKIFETAQAEFGGADILINNAGITKDNLMLRMSTEDFESVLAVNLTGAFNCLKTAGRTMIKNKKGRIVNISSVAGLSGNAGQANYAASKAGLIGLTKSAARELAKRNITVNAVAPGFIETDMSAVLSDDIKSNLLSAIPMQRFGSPEDAANAVLFLCSDEASYITGQVLCVDGGMAM